jgi:hypothetical protein
VPSVRTVNVGVSTTAFAAFDSYCGTYDFSPCTLPYMATNVQAATIYKLQVRTRPRLPAAVRSQSTAARMAGFPPRPPSISP